MASNSEFLRAVQAALPGLDLRRVKYRTFGRSAEMANILVPLIASGQKTGTFALAAEFESDPQAAPQVGDLYVVTWFDGTPALLYRITEIETVPFNAINERHVQVEGPNARDVAIWRSIHWPYFGSWLRERGREPSEDMPVIFQRFELLYVAPRA
ncbi:MAG: ASCH domain-containing protein [Steroidobacteraceae bacterium]|nr:ASCH domain-containing protein [Steroidobacteraceae bacterium]MDW8259667.1 ASCH domain-containing protein [Gammaproteobacteria bacterium]